MSRNSRREDASRMHHDYKIGDTIFLKKPGILRKIESPRTGPHLITVVYSNGTIHIQNGNVSQRVNIRRVIPYFVTTLVIRKQM
jgi:hypothetical protein